MTRVQAGVPPASVITIETNLHHSVGAIFVFALSLAGSNGAKH
jgi:hypothetical protein